MANNAASIEAARARREVASQKRLVRVEWFIEEFQKKVNVSMRSRMRLAVQFLKDRITVNISTAVKKEVQSYTSSDPTTGATKQRQRTVVTERSKRGEFPRADTTQLMKSLIADVRESDGKVEGFVGSPMGYAIPLELVLERQFLTRTLNEEKQTLQRILAAPLDIRGE